MAKVLYTKPRVMPERYVEISKCHHPDRLSWWTLSVRKDEEEVAIENERNDVKTNEEAEWRAQVIADKEQINFILNLQFK